MMVAYCGHGQSYGVFLGYYLSHNYIPGATALQFAFIGGLSFSVALLVAPFATVCERRCGTRISLLLGVLFETAGFLGASWTATVWQLFLSQGLAFGIGMGFLFVTSVGIVPQWFLKRRSFANSIATGGSGIGGMIYSLGTSSMIQTIGVPWAFRVLAIVCCMVNLVCTFLIRDRNKSTGAVLLAFDIKLFRRPEFLVLLTWGIFSMLGYVALLFSLPDFAVSIGLSSQQGSIVGALLNLGQGELSHDSLFKRPCFVHIEMWTHANTTVKASDALSLAITVTSVVASTSQGYAPFSQGCSAWSFGYLQKPTAF